MERIKVGHIYKRQGHGANQDRTFFVKVKDMEGTMVGLDYKLQDKKNFFFLLVTG